MTRMFAAFGYFMLLLSISLGSLRADEVSVLDLNSSVKGCAIGNIGFKTTDRKLIDDIMNGRTDAKKLLTNESTNSLLMAIPESQRLQALQLLIDCIKLNIPAKSRITSKNDDSIVIGAGDAPIDVFGKIYCSSEDFRAHVSAGLTLRRFSKKYIPNGSPEIAELDAWFEDSFPGILADENIRRVITGVRKPPTCPPADSCVMRGSAAVQALDERKQNFGRTYRKVLVEQGACSGKTGFVDESVLQF